VCAVCVRVQACALFARMQAPAQRPATRLTVSALARGWWRPLHHAPALEVQTGLLRARVAQTPAPPTDGSAQTAGSAGSGVGVDARGGGSAGRELADVRASLAIKEAALRDATHELQQLRELAQVCVGCWVLGVGCVRRTPLQALVAACSCSCAHALAPATWPLCTGRRA
jgi:hypothetical protein